MAADFYPETPIPFGVLEAGVYRRFTVYRPIGGLNHDYDFFFDYYAVLQHECAARGAVGFVFESAEACEAAIEATDDRFVAKLYDPIP